MSSLPDRLESWKEIADYLGKGVTTVRRWEREEGLPVRRMEHIKRGSVVAYKSELDTWVRSRTTTLPEAEAPEAPPQTRSWGVPFAIGTGLLAAIGLAGLLARQPAPPLELQNVALTSDPGLEEAPSLSPDGNRVVYEASGRGKANGLYIKPVPGGEPIRLTSSGDGFDVFPRWSPDGSRILFTRLSSEQWLDLMLIPAAGGEPRLVLRRERPSTPGFRREWASWMPDGRSILLIDRATLLEPWAMFQYWLDSGRRDRLTAPPAAIFGDLVASASPDGKRIAFARFRSGTESDIFLTAAKPGAEPARLTWDSSFHTGIAWEPGGEWLIYATTRMGSGPGLWRIRAARGERAEPVTGAETDAIWPSSAHSARELRIAYQRSFEIVNVRRWDGPGRPGAEPRTLSKSSRHERVPQFSPDGTRIAFSSTASTRRGAREIWVCDAEGRGIRQLTWMNQPWADSPRWSPDGAHIAFSNTEGDNRDIYIVDGQGGSLRRLTTEPSEEGRPSWSRDGKWIYFRSTRTGSDEIWKKAADGSGIGIAVTTKGGYEPFESPDGRWLYFAKNRTREGLWRILTTGGGAEEQVAGQVREGLWSVAVDGIYFIRLLPKPGLWRLKFGERTPELLTGIAVPAGGIYSGFSARADGRSFLWPQTSDHVSDVMMLQAKGN